MTEASREPLRRPHGTGSISQRKDGRWMGQADFGYTRGGRCRKSVYAWTRAEVEQKLAMLLATGGDGLNAHMPGEMTRAEAITAADEIATHTAEQWVAKRNAVGCCVYCGSPGPLVVDHATPVTRGGSNGIENVVPACVPCNSSKGNLTAAEYLRRILP